MPCPSQVICMKRRLRHRPMGWRIQLQLGIQWKESFTTGHKSADGNLCDASDDLYTVEVSLFVKGLYKFAGGKLRQNIQHEPGSVC